MFRAHRVSLFTACAVSGAVLQAAPALALLFRSGLALGLPAEAGDGAASAIAHALVGTVLLIGAALQVCAAVAVRQRRSWAWKGAVTVTAVNATMVLVSFAGGLGLVYPFGVGLSLLAFVTLVAPGTRDAFLSDAEGVGPEPAA